MIGMNTKGQGVWAILVIVFIAVILGIAGYNFFTGQRIVSQTCTTVTGVIGFVNAQGFCEAIPFQAGVTPTGGGVLTGNPQLTVPIADQKTGQALGGTVYLRSGTTDVTSATATDSAGASLTGLTSNVIYDTVVVDASGGNGFFYSVKTTLQAPSAGSVIASPVKVFSINSTAPSITCYKIDDVTANTASARQAIAANEQVTMRCRIRTASTVNDNNVFSDNVLPPAIVLDYNSQALTQISMKEGSISLGGTSVTGHQPDIDGNVTRTSTVAFAMQTKSLTPATDYDVYFNLKAGSIDPTDTSTTVADNNGAVFVTIYDGCLVKNTLTQTYQEVYKNPNTLANVCATNYHTDLFYS